MKKLIALVALAGLLCLGGSAMANIGAADVVPAATLLIPRFEVDLSDPAGLTTLFSINNASQESVLAHVTLWTEWWIPIIDFDVYLTGYDVQTLNVRDILNGNLPKTGIRPQSGFPPVGPYSGPHPTSGVFAALGCGDGSVGSPPNYGPVAASFVQLVQQAFSGQPISLLAGACASLNLNTTLARGYITVDSVNFCSQEFPSNDGYFVDGGIGVANNNNVLWGDFFFVDPTENFAQGFAAVHIEADSVALSTNFSPCDSLFAPSAVFPDGIPGNAFPYTFYCSLTQFTAPGADNREALASVYGSRYLLGGGFTGGTSLISWRDPLLGAFDPIPCRSAGGSLLAPFAMEQEQIVRFDEEENVVIPGGPSGQPDIVEYPFPWCTNRSVVGSDISVNADFGWLYVNLNDANTEEPVASFFTHNQAYLATVLDASGLFSVGYEAVQLNNLNRTYFGNTNPVLTTYGPNFNAPTLSQFPSFYSPSNYFNPFP